MTLSSSSLSSSSSANLSMTSTTINTDALANTTHAIQLKDGSYKGELENNLPNGKGKLTYAENNSRKSYEGDFVNGAFEGQGIMIWRNLRKYEGEFHENEIDGKGTMTMGGTLLVNIKEIRTGNFKNGKLYGNAKVQKLENEQIIESQEGFFQNNLLQKGKITTTKEQQIIVKEGSFKEAELHGANGTIKILERGKLVELQEGTFENGVLKSGTITLFRAPQIKEERKGNFKDGELDGEGTIKITQYGEQLIECLGGNFKDGKLHEGTAKILKKNVFHLFSGEWQNDQLWNGQEKFQNQTLEYENGKIKENGCCSIIQNSSCVML